MAASKEEVSSNQQPDCSQYTVLTLAQLYFVIDKAPVVSSLYTNFSWKEVDTLSIYGAKLIKVETKNWAFISSKFYNRGYRILAERKSDNATVLLCEGDNSYAGRDKVDSYWKDIQNALQRSLVISSTIQALDSREIGHYQEPTAVITGPNSLEGQPSAEFYQTIHYATVRKWGAQDTKKIADFYTSDADKRPNLHVGIAQCSIPSQKFLMKGALPRENSFVSKLFQSKKKKRMPMRISYINEMEMDKFRESLVENINDCYVSYLRYLHSSIENMADVVCNEEDSIAIKKVLVKDLSHKFYGATDPEQLEALHKKAKSLNDDEKEYLEVLKQFETKLCAPSKNQNEDILLYIHGFNNSVEESLLRASQIACDIGFGGRLAVFSWPSLESPILYYQDKDQIDVAFRKFLDFLVILCQSARKVHIIAHSLANLLFTRSVLAAPAQCKGKLGQLICAHADVKVEFFLDVFKDSDMVGGIESIVDNVTVYFHRRDKALWWAADSIFGTRDRIGRQEARQLPNEEKLENVNIGEMATSRESMFCFFGNIATIKHNVYAEDPTVLEDMSEIINGGLKAYQRRHIKMACPCGIKKAHDITKKLNCHLCNKKYEYVLDTYVL